MVLREYQDKIAQEAAAKIMKLHFVYLAMEVRTGKTITALSICDRLDFVQNVLFVTKKNAIGSIKKDSLHFPSLNVIAINYESVHKITVDYDIVIIDEAHGLGKYPKPAERTKKLKGMIADRKVIALSGTPSPESYSQLFHQFWVSQHSPFKEYTNFYKWAKDFVNVKKKYVYGREINDYSAANIELIEKHTNKYFISFTQKQSGFDVKINEKILYVDAGKKVKDAIRILKRDKVIEGKKGIVIADTAVKMQQKIHQISSGTVKDEDGNVHILSTAKADFIAKHFAGQRIVIFYKFIGEFNALKSVFEGKWTNVPDDFQSGLNGVYLGQFISSREGIRLDTADCIIFYNIDFSFLSYEQARNRIVSKERTKEAILYWIFTTGGIEDKIYQAVCEKKDYTASYFRKDYGFTNKEFKGMEGVREQFIAQGKIKPNKNG